ncbi:MAG: glycosyltransferase family 4 protein [Candidatus Saelkia tenebricola]|nr:glycosyltransferase family 4 protein [Candidatus Saelkia tenebricola]
MNILLLTKHLNLGGIPRYVIDLGDILIKKGHKVWIASSGGTLLKEIEGTNITHIYIPIKTKSILSPKIILSWMILRKKLKTHKIDIIHSHTRVTSVIAYLLSKSLNIKYLTTTHGLYKKSVLRNIFSFLGYCTIAISSQTSERLITWMGLNPRKIQIIPNGINVQKFSDYDLTKSEARQKINIPLESFVIGNISRIEKIKGQEIIIRAVFRLKDKIPNLKLLLVGDGKYRHILIKLVAELKLNDKVIILPASENIRPALRAMDLFCFTPYEEPFGLVLLEAMAMEVPIIASDVSEIPEILNFGNCGVLIQAGNEKSLQEATEQVYKNKIPLKDITGKALKRVQEKYSRENMVDKTIQVYTDILEK